jgi:hypothetical protein
MKEFFAGIVGVIALVIVVLVIIKRTHGDPNDTKHADRDVLPSVVKVVCVEGFEYIYVSGVYRAAMAPKWDEDGKPARCSP